jgi:hypothetical protein
MEPDRMCLRDVLQEGQGFELYGGRLEVFDWTAPIGAAEERLDCEIEHEFAVVIEEDGAAVVMRTMALLKLGRKRK